MKQKTCARGICLVLLLAIFITLLAACKANPTVTGDSAGGGAREDNSAGKGQDSSANKDPLVIGQHIGAGDILSVVTRCFSGESDEEPYDYEIVRGSDGYFLSAEYISDGQSVALKDIPVDKADWDGIISFINGKKVGFAASENSGIEVLDLAEIYASCTWRGQKEADQGRELLLGSDEEYEALAELFRQIAVRYEPLILGKNFLEGDAGKITFGLGRVWNYSEFKVSFDGLGRKMNFSYISNEERKQGTTYSLVEGVIDLTQQEAKELWKLLEGKSLREDAADQEDQFLCTISKRGNQEAVYYIDLDMADADALFSYFQNLRKKYASLSIPEKADLADYHGASLLSALDGVSRADLVSKWGAPDSGIGAGDFDTWALTDSLEIQISYSDTNGKVYDAAVIEK